LLEFDDAVESYESQPVAIFYLREGGRKCEGFPDISVSYRKDTGRPGEIQDVKYRSELREDWAHLKPRLRAASSYARSVGKSYRLRTDKQIRIPFLRQATFLYRYLLNVTPDERRVAAFLETLHRLEQCSIAALLRDCFPDDVERAEALPTLWHLVASNLIAADQDLPLTMHSYVWEPKAVP
jgi:hypothetical protein